MNYQNGKIFLSSARSLSQRTAVARTEPDQSDPIQVAWTPGLRPSFRYFPRCISRKLGPKLSNWEWSRHSIMERWC